jgi:hypothetical protein
VKTNPKLLVLDENPDLRTLVGLTLRKRLSCVVVEAGGVEEAIALAEQEHVDLIVSGFGKAIRFGENLAKALSDRESSTLLLFYSIHETTRFDLGGKNWSVVQIFNPEFDDLVKVVGDAFGLEDKGSPASPRKLR